MSDKDSSSNGSGSRDARMRGKRILAATLTLWLLPGVLGAVAMAQPAALPSLDGVLAPAPVGSWRVDALDWLSVRDTSGVPLSSYTLALDSGNNPLDLLRMGVILLLGVEFVGYMVIVTLAIGLLGYALSFRWLDLISGALTGVAAKVTQQIATPLLMAVAAAIGAVCVGWFVVRGLPAKATAQVVTMLGVAIVGVSYLADPLGDVLSSDGLLAHGRDLGISVAAGLNGQSHPDPGALTAAMQAVMADNFARKPVQVWNFGHVLDQWPSCRDAWSGSVRSGRDGAVLGAIKQCGDSDGYAKASTPGMGQLGTGLVLLLCAAVLLVFAVYLALKIVRTALNAVHHGLLAIFGFAAGGFVYGPTQTFLVRNLVDAVVAAGRMVAYTIFLGAYLLFLGGLFEQAQGQVMAVLVLGCAVMLAAVTQLRKLGSGLSRGNDWIADRVASAIQGQAGRSGAGGRALGMGQGGAAASLPGAALVALGALNTVNSNPLTGMVFRNNNPLNQFARGRKVKSRQD
ncbi:MAG: hypothetical protein HOQ24_05895, partial [Mycobacteriaceae bacterium]|nr:hypothetical protein [Mycobacteriaceae bacterium]